MTTGRLSALAIMNIHQGHHVNYEEVVRKCFVLRPRKFICSNLIFDGLCDFLKKKDMYLNVKVIISVDSEI